MSDFHKRKEAEKANKKLVFSQASLEEWRERERIVIRQQMMTEVKESVMKQIQADIDAANRRLAEDRRKAIEEIEERGKEMQARIDANKHGITSDAIDQAFILMIGIPVRAMKEEFGWGKKVRLPRLGEVICRYYEEFQNGDMDIKEYQKMIWEQCGIGFTMTEEGEDLSQAAERYDEWLSKE